jgi:hypothetical protein
METSSIAVLIPMVVSVSLFAMIFGIVYLDKKQKMAMIERGMDPRANKPVPASNNSLTWGLLLIGAGLGLFLAYILDRTVFTRTIDDNQAIYFALIAIFGGLGLFVSYRIEKREISDKN